MLDFIGRPAPSGIMVAELALKYDVPLIPCYGTRAADGVHVDVEFEAPVARGSAREMMQAVQDSLANRVRQRPEQYFWLHLRWKKDFGDGSV